MGYYTSYYIEVDIDENYREFFNKIYSGERCEVCTECLKGVYDCTSLKTLEFDVDCSYCPKRFNDRKFNTEREAKYYHTPKCVFDNLIIRSNKDSYYFSDKEKYDVETGKLIISAYEKNYNHEVEKFIRYCILPFGKVIRYKSHDSNYCLDCEEGVCKDNTDGTFHSENEYKQEYVKKYKYILDKLDSS